MDRTIVALLVISLVGLAAGFVAVRGALVGRDVKDRLRGRTSLDPNVTPAQNAELIPARHAA